MQDVSRPFQNIEYGALYQEILENTKTIYSILSICIAAFTAIVSGIAVIINGFLTHLPTPQPSSPSLTELDYKVFFFPFLFLLPFLVLLPSIILVTSSLNSTARIATYMQVFYENNNKNGISWQTRIQRFRKEKQFRVLSGSLSFLFNIIGFACLGFSLITETLVFFFVIIKGNINYITILITVVYLITILGLFWRLLFLTKQLREKWSDEYFDKLTDAWERIRVNS